MLLALVFWQSLGLAQQSCQVPAVVHAGDWGEKTQVCTVQARGWGHVSPSLCRVFPGRWTSHQASQQAAPLPAACPPFDLSLQCLHMLASENRADGASALAQPSHLPLVQPQLTQGPSPAPPNTTSHPFPPFPSPRLLNQVVLINTLQCPSLNSVSLLGLCPTWDCRC